MNHEELIGSLKKLRLPAMADEYVATARVAEKTKKTYEQYLGQCRFLKPPHPSASALSYFF